LNKDINAKVSKLSELSEDFTLSHAVLATAKMIEDTVKKRRNSEKEDEKFLENYEKNNLKNEYISKRIEQNGTKDKIYISVEYLSDKSTTEGARTFCYNREVHPIEGEEISRSEHFEIVLPPKDRIPVLAYENKRLSKKCVRFLVGHELGHLWLHLDKIREIKDIRGTSLLPKELESEANAFSFELSDIRDKHILKRAEYISKNKK